MNATTAVNLVLREMELQDPTGHCDTIYMSSTLARALCKAPQVNIPDDVIKQDGFAAFEQIDLFGYAPRVDRKLRGFELELRLDNPLD